MGQGFAWFFDIAIIIVLIVCIYMGGKKGFLRTAVLLIGYVIAALGGYFISVITSYSIHYTKLYDPEQNCFIFCPILV